MKNLFSIFTACMLFLNAATAQIVNIPDANFKYALVNSACALIGTSTTFTDIDTNNDGEVQVSEAAVVKELYVSYKQIASLVGISNFTSLQYLNCSQNQLMSLNLQGLTNLEIIESAYNQLNTIEVQGLLNLRILKCNNNQLASINTQGLTSLETLYCYINQITTLNVQGLTALKALYCYQNQIAVLNVQGLTTLLSLLCHENQISSLDVRGMTNLYALWCNNNLLTTVNTSDIPPSAEIYCDNNLLTSLRITNVNNANNLTFSNNPNLAYICCKADQITQIQAKATQYGYTNCLVNAACTVATENQTDTILELYLRPNPVSDILTFKTDAMIEKCEIYDNLGRVVDTVLELYQKNQQINVAHLPKGIYFVKVYAQEGTAVRKFVVN
jgi:Leucine-rich repeat (LRR) protein